jgi:hypothetical protein
MDYGLVIKKLLPYVQFNSHTEFDCKGTIYFAHIYCADTKLIFEKFSKNYCHVEPQHNDNPDKFIEIRITSEYYKQYLEDRQRFINELFAYKNIKMCKIILYRELIDCNLKINAKIVFCHKRVKILQPIICKSVVLHRINEGNLLMITADEYIFNVLKQEDFLGKAFLNVKNLVTTYIKDELDIDFIEYIRILMQSFPNVISYKDSLGRNVFFDCLITKYYMIIKVNDIHHKYLITVINTKHDWFVQLELDSLMEFEVTKNSLRNKCEQPDVINAGGVDFISDHHLIFVNTVISDFKLQPLIKNAAKI